MPMVPRILTGLAALAIAGPFAGAAIAQLVGARRRLRLALGEGV